MMKLQEYDCMIVYKLGETHLELDCLSCHPQPLQTRECNDINDAFVFSLQLASYLAEEQDKDLVLNELKESITNDPTHPAH